MGDEHQADPADIGRWQRHRTMRRELAAKQGWWLVLGAALLVAWGRLWSRSLDPPGPATLDWAANLVRSLEFQLGCAVLLLLVGAVLRRAWGQAAVATLVAIITVGVPLVHGLGSAPDATPERRATQLRLLSLNVLVHNTDVAATARRIRAADADVVLVQEYGKVWAEELPEALEDDWRLVVASPRDDSFGVAAFVRNGLFPSIHGETFTVGEFDLPQLRLEVDEGGDEAFVLYVAHVQPPISPRGFRLAAGEVRELRDRVRREYTPVLVAGDFNAVGGSAIDRAMQRESRVQLRDAWDDAGDGPGWTWPRNGILAYVPGVRIDHVYVDDSWDVHRIRRLSSAGSDHRPVLVDLSVS